MKKLLLLGVSVAIWCGTSLALADTNVKTSTDDKFKVGVVSVEDVLQNYAKVPQMEEKLKKQFTPQQEKLVATQKQINDEISKFNRDSSVMKAADKKTAQDKIVKEQQDFQKMQMDFQKQFVVSRDQAMKTVFDDIKAAVSQVAKEQGYNLVLAKANIAYSDQNLDITDLVIKKLKTSK